MRFLVHLSDGLGNQMFQYAAGRYYAGQHAAKMERLLPPTRETSDPAPARPFMLARFQTGAAAHVRTRAEELISDGRRRYRAPLAPWRALTRTFAVNEPFAERYVFKPALPIPRYTRRVHLAGYWQVHQIADAISQELRREFAFRNPPIGENARVLAAIRQCAEPVSVHLRRGDYKNFLDGDVTLPLSYYAHALQHVQAQVPDPTFVIFSDEPEFARQNLPTMEKAIFVHHNDALRADEDLRLMSCCKHHVIANSSFSWWGAWLNADVRKLVCAPSVWLGSPVRGSDILPPLLGPAKPLTPKPTTSSSLSASRIPHPASCRRHLCPSAFHLPMSRVHLVFLPPDDPRSPGQPPHPDGTLPLRESQRADRFRQHTLTDDPAAADLILIVRTLSHDGSPLLRLRAHPLVRRFRRKCFLYDLNDRVAPVLPGIYPSMERRWHRRWRTRFGPYLDEVSNPFLTYDPAPTEPRYLYSFLGAVRSAPVRDRLAAMPSDPRSLFLDTSARAEQVARHGTNEEKREFARQYADATKLSAFVLCPRGVGTGSRRLFETMMMGRAPVVLADDWVPPDGPAWERSCVFIAEKDAAQTPQILASRAADAPEMGREARRQWEEWYAPEVLFHRTVESCLDIAQTRSPWPGPVASWAANAQSLRPSLLRHWARQTGFNQRMKSRLRALVGK